MTKKVCLTKHQVKNTLFASSATNLRMKITRITANQFSTNTTVLEVQNKTFFTCHS